MRAEGGRVECSLADIRKKQRNGGILTDADTDIGTDIDTETDTTDRQRYTGARTHTHTHTVTGPEVEKELVAGDRGSRKE